MPTEFVIPRDDDGEILPHDHPNLVQGHRIIRRISEEYIVSDANTGQSRISSALFKNDPRQGYLSIDSETCILEKDRPPADWVTSPHWKAALIITAENFRGLDAAKTAESRWKVGMIPLDENHCHGGVWGKITKGQSNDLQRHSEWLVVLPGVEKLV